MKRTLFGNTETIPAHGQAWGDHQGRTSAAAEKRETLPFRSNLAQPRALPWTRGPSSPRSRLERRSAGSPCSAEARWPCAGKVLADLAARQTRCGAGRAGLVPLAEACRAAPSIIRNAGGANLGFYGKIPCVPTNKDEHDDAERTFQECHIDQRRHPGGIRDLCIRIGRLRSIRSRMARAPRAPGTDLCCVGCRDAERERLWIRRGRGHR